MNGPVRPLLLALAAAAIACATPTGPRPPAAAPASAPAVVAHPARAAPAPAAAVVPGLSFNVEPSAAELVIDGKSLGRVSDLSGGFVQLPPGLYQVSLKHAGFTTWRAEVAVRTGVETLRVTLTRKP